MNSMEIPKLKKKISAYLLGEDGKISKQALLSLGSFLGSAIIGSSIFAHNAEGIPHQCNENAGAAEANNNFCCHSVQEPACVTDHNTDYNCHYNKLTNFDYHKAGDSFTVDAQHDHAIHHCSY